MGPGFNDFFERYENWPWHDAAEFRQRHLLRALEGKRRR
jgi:hypothetical protein